MNSNTFVPVFLCFLPFCDSFYTPEETVNNGGDLSLGDGSLGLKTIFARHQLSDQE